MTLRIITPPAAEPVSIDEVKQLGRIDAGEDTMFDMLIASARRSAEDLTGRALILQTWELVLDAFPDKEIRIGMLPIQSIVSVKYYDPAGALQTMDPADYVLDVDTLPGWLLPARDVTWPATLDMAQAVIVRFVAGYGNTGADVPAPIRHWIILHAVHAYDNPARVQVGNIVQDFPRDTVDGLLDPYRLRLMA